MIRQIAGCVVSKLDDGAGAVDLYAVMREQETKEWAEHAALRATRVENVVLPNRTAWGLPTRKFRIQSHRTVLSLMSLSSMTNLEGTMGMNAKL